jgi:hypothetical protein
VALTQLSTSWRFTRFEELRALIASVYKRDGLELAAAVPATEDDAPSDNRARAAAWVDGGSGSSSTAGSGAEPVPAAPERRGRGRPRKEQAPAGAPAAAGPRVAAAGAVDSAHAGVVGASAAAALSAAGGQVLPGLLGGGGVEVATSSGAFAASRRMGTAAVGAMALELVEDEGSDNEGGAASGRVKASSGRARAAAAARAAHGVQGSNVWRRVWEEGGRLVLVVHDEAASSKHNLVEVEIIRRIMEVRAGSLQESHAYRPLGGGR